MKEGKLQKGDNLEDKPTSARVKEAFVGLLLQNMVKSDELAIPFLYISLSSPEINLYLFLSATCTLFLLDSA